MNNYICINGLKTELTAEQLKDLGLSVPRDVSRYSAKEISDIVRSGEARRYFKVHDTLTIEGREFEIIGFNHDKDADDADAPTMTVMGKTIIAERCMNDGACERGWIDAELRAWLNHTYLNSLSVELHSLIRPIRKITHSSDGKVYKTIDKLFIPSESELIGSAYWSPYEDGKRYEAFATSEDRIRLDEDGDSVWYWNRSSHAGSAAYFCVVGHYGIAYFAASTALGVPLCFSL